MPGLPPLATRLVLMIVALVAAPLLAGCGGQSMALPASTTAPSAAAADASALGDSLDLPTAPGGVPPIPTTLVPPTLDLPAYTAELDIVTCQLEVSVPNDSLGFTVSSADIPPGPGRDLLVEIADDLSGAAEVVIVGHSSSEGDLAFNIDLSRRRAEAAAAILRPLLPDSTLDVSGVGPAEPLVVEDGTEATRAPNRRVELSGEVTQEVCQSARDGGAALTP
jgi:outer membrane protein OmpA-like peptidoglycan-associated protein